MHIVNFLLIPIILISLFYKIKLSYLISVLGSLAASTFIYVQQSLTDILFTIAIFNLTPLACFHFKRIIQQSRFSLEDKRAEESKTYQQMLKERSLLSQSNSQIDTGVSRIAELYKITRDMSEALKFKDIFEIFVRKMMELFRFKRCRLILIEEESGLSRIEKVFELKYNQPQVNQVDWEALDAEILKQSFNQQKITYEEGFIAQAPLMVDRKFLGTLVVEDLPADAIDNFSILVNQFNLEFKRIKLYEKVQELAITDGLTRLFSRRHFLERLDEEIKRSARHNLRLAFLMVDIDHFKQCNDNYGHLAGDIVLKEIARQILDNIREIDLAARFGGEEFSILLPNTDKQGARFVAERIRTSIERYSFKAYSAVIKVSVSIGVSSFPEDSTEAQQLIDKSDRALYRAKQEGRNRVCLAV